MRLLVPTLPALCWASTAPPKKHIWPFECVAHSADLIVVGEIVDVGSRSVQVRVDEQVHGDARGKVIEVAKWEEWTCDQRFAPYEKGQQLLLMLGSSKGRYVPINASTGEIPIRDGAITIYRGGMTFQLHELITAIKEVRNCFQVTSPYGPAFSERESRMVLKWKCPEGSRSEPAPNKAMEWLLERSRAYEVSGDR